MVACGWPSLPKNERANEKGGEYRPRKKFHCVPFGKREQCYERVRSYRKARNPYRGNPLGVFLSANRSIDRAARFTSCNPSQIPHRWDGGRLLQPSSSYGRRSQPHESSLTHESPPESLHQGSQEICRARAGTESHRPTAHQTDLGHTPHAPKDQGPARSPQALRAAQGERAGLDPLGACTSLTLSRVRQPPGTGKSPGAGFNSWAAHHLSLVRSETIRGKASQLT